MHYYLIRPSYEGGGGHRAHPVGTLHGMVVAEAALGEIISGKGSTGGAWRNGQVLFPP